MKTHTSEFKNNIKRFGREIDSKFTFTYNDEEIDINDESMMSVSPHYESSILKSVMKELDIESKEDLQIGTIVNYQLGIKVRNNDVEDYRDNYDYINYGNYIVYSSEKKEDTNTYKIKCYDNMIKAMVNYENISLTFPLTIREYINAVCSYLGLTFKNINDTFANYNKVLQVDPFLDAQLNSMGYTFRDVFDQLAQVTGSVICINEEDDTLEIRYINNTSDTIDEEFLKDINVNFGEQYSINTIVLSRSADTDKIYMSYPSDLPEEDRKAFEIKDNQIMNNNDRDTYMPDILSKLLDINFFINDYSSTGVCYYNLYDKYSISIGDEIYGCLMLNDDVTIKSGLTENISADKPNETETDYTKADKTDRRINQTYLIVDKQNQTIESVVTNVTEQNNKISQISQTVDEINSKISDIADITISGESNFATFTLDNINASEPIQIKVKPISESISYLYPNINLYPSNSTYLKVRTIRFHNNTTDEDVDYVLPDDLLIYDSTHYDEFYLDYDSQTCQIKKRCEYNADGSVALLASEEIVDYPYPTITLEDGDYTMTLLGYEYGYLFIRLMAKNIYTTQFYTKAETESRINQKASEIEIGVDQTLTNYSTTAQMNAAINVKANEINSVVSTKVGNNEIISKINQSAEQVNISANKINLNGVVTANQNFKILNDGSMEATNGKFNGKVTSADGTIGTWNINNDGIYNNNGFYINNYSLQYQGQTYNVGVSNIYTMSDILICQLILLGVIPMPSSGTPEFAHYDVNKDGVINSGDLLAIRYILNQL